MARRTIGQRKMEAVAQRQKVHVRRGDRVKVIRGNHAGVEGTVLQVLPKDGRVVIEGVNERKRHAKPTNASPEGGIIKFFAPIHASNVMLIDSNTGEPTRVRRQTDKDGTKERISVRTGKTVPRAGA